MNPWSCGWRRRASRRDDPLQPYSQVTLLFESAQMEAGFIERQKDFLISRLKLLDAIALSLNIFTITFNIVAHKQHQRETFDNDIAYGASRTSLAILATSALALILGLMVMNCAWLMRKTSPLVIEISSTLLATVCMAVAVLRSPERFVKIAGYTVQEAFGDRYFSDSHALLMIDGVITALHLGCPVRWCCLFMIEVAGVAIFGFIIFVLGSNEPASHDVFSFLFLNALIFLAAMGKRAAEIGERQAFMDIIKEKQRRCEVEFKLSQAGGDRTERRQRAQDAASDAPSVAVTTLSTMVFDPPSFHDDRDITKQLARVKELGNSEHWCIDETEVAFHAREVLGRGGFGQVVKAVWCGVAVAVKFPYDKLEASNLKALPDLCRELRILRYLRHPNIVVIHGAMVDARLRQVALVLELIQGVVLDKYVVDREPSLIARYQLMLGVCNALLYLHTRHPHIVHGDLKSKNVMVDLSGDGPKSKLLDFGLSRVLTPHTQHLGGTLNWMAPEVFRPDAEVKCSADIFSLGRLIAFIATSTPPSSYLGGIKQTMASALAKPPAPTWPAGCAFEASCKDLVQSCLEVDESARPGIRRVHSLLVRLPHWMDLAGVGADEESGEVPARPPPPQPQPAAAAPPVPVPEPKQQAPREALEGGRLPRLPEEEELRPDRANEAVPSAALPENGLFEGRPEDAPQRPAAPGQAEAKTLRAPSQPKTREEEMEAALLAAISRWNFEVSCHRCCEKHAGVGIAWQICSKMLSSPCSPEPLPFPGPLPCGEHPKVPLLQL